MNVESAPRFSLADHGTSSAACNVFLYRQSIRVSITWDSERRCATARRLDTCGLKDFPSIVAWLIFHARSWFRLEGSACWSLNAEDRQIIRTLEGQRSAGVSVTIGLDTAALGAQLEKAANEGGLAYVEAFRGLVARIEECVAERPQTAAAWVVAAIDCGQRWCQNWSDETRQHADVLWVRLFQAAARTPAKYRFPIVLALGRAAKRGEQWPSACGAELAQLRDHPHAHMVETAQRIAPLTGEARQQALDRVLLFCRSDGDEPASSRADLIVLLALLLGADNLRKDPTTRELLGGAAIDLANSGELKGLLGLGAQMTNGTVAEGIELMLAQHPDARAAWMRAWLAGGLLDPLREKELPGRIHMLMHLLESRQADLPLDLRATIAQALTDRLTRMASTKSPLLANLNLPAGFDLLERSLPREGKDHAHEALQALKRLWTDPLPRVASAR
ncbi:hypothetical protein [Cupriavidus sp. AU9028]|uniref:hypothetical protein n=1 Tax=Cupriavidus sp. AU9028 TaxID=2871157 RepID=UPI001C976808|nr:hypothetical protein [Cupriavidus sp. AU9028]MBY4896707.1 hypothetical protein [Cupriavidus sp. AU9028]